ncbi:MAG: asparagine synthase (glutamine-hydrolyzing), partial [Syntrophaceae bacterium]|nr:asparagine synthase (glutamine-hydrolyzing) [Syntrophaceae bacterium]
GHQPMCFADGQCWITYNGEIYNYIELRQELENAGHQFRSGTDTEAILHAYAEWGEECLQRFNGMWAFIIYDRKRNLIFASRDRFGIKPLYYRLIDGGVAFASEIKQFTKLPGWCAAMNKQRCFDFLAYSLFDHTSETMFEGVFQLKGGEKALIDLNGPTPGIDVKAWYSLSEERISICRRDAERKVKELFHSAVALRLRADVKVGSCLSGGIDSSSIVCMVNEILSQKGISDIQETFSSCAEDKEFDERQYIQAVVDKTRTANKQVFPGMIDLLANIEQGVWIQDEPFISSSVYAQNKVFELAALSRVKVMLDGQGADELMAGYDTFRAAHQAGLLTHGKIWCLLKELTATKRLYGQGYRSQLYAILRRMTPANLALAYVPRKRLQRYLNLSFFEDGRIDLSPARYRVAPKQTTLRDLSLGELSCLRLPMLLHYEDRNSMAHSLESRVPFLDYRLVEFILNLPDDYKIFEGETKHLFRHAMQSVLPGIIFNRHDKMGFVTPEAKWLKENPQIFSELFELAITRCGDIFSMSGIEDMFNAFLTGRREFDFTFWQIISFGAWVKVFDVQA